MRYYAKLLRAMLTAIMLVVMARAAIAGPWEDAVAAHGRGDYATTLRLLRPLADQGLAKAQERLGALYYGGQGVAQDYTEAVKWFRLAAEQRRRQRAIRSRFDVSQRPRRAARLQLRP